MALSLLNHVVADLCLGKPALKSLSLSSAITVGDALSAIKASQEHFITIWNCNHHRKSTSETNNNNNNNTNNNNINKSNSSCECLGKICMVDIICFLCKKENLASPASALLSPVSALLKDHDSALVKHIDPSTSLLEAMDLLLQGAQNLVVPIQSPNSPSSRRRQQKAATIGGGPTFHNGREYCWLTLEDMMQFILSRIGLFTPIPNLSVEALGIIQTEILTVDYHAPASMALDAIGRALADQTSVGVVDEYGSLVGEISPFTLSAGCDETVAAAIMTLSAGDLMAYIDWGGPPEDMVRVMRARLTENKLDGLLEMLDDDYSSSNSSLSSSSDDESLASSSPTTKLTRHHRSWSYSARMVREAEAIVCHPRSSLVAVLIQAIAHRVNYVWVMDDDCTLIGIVTFSDMLEVFREHLQSMLEECCNP